MPCILGMHCALYETLASTATADIVSRLLCRLLRLKDLHACNGHLRLTAASAVVQRKDMAPRGCSTGGCAAMIYCNWLLLMLPCEWGRVSRPV